MKNARINWRDLEVIDCEGDSWGQLGDVINDIDLNHILKTATIVDGVIDSWFGFYLADPNSDDDYADVEYEDNLNIDWTDFSAALAGIRTDED